MEKLRLISEEERKHKNKDPYQRFIKENETNIVTGRIFEQNPLISFVVPVYNVPDDMLTACIDSIIGQTYKNWELWLVDDFSSWESVREVLHSYETTPGVHVIYRTENEIFPKQQMMELQKQVVNTSHLWTVMM